MAVIFVWVFWWKVVMKSEKAGVGGWLNWCGGWFGEDVGGLTPKIFPGGGWHWGGGTLRYPWYIHVNNVYMDVSKNSGTPKSSILIRVVHYKPSILGSPYFWKHPYRDYIINLFEVSLLSNHIFPSGSQRKKTFRFDCGIKISPPFRSFLRFPSPRAPSACAHRGLWWLPHKWMKGRWSCLGPVALAIHPGRVTWNGKMEVWMMIFLFNWHLGDC